ncbi:hypothetical protein [Phaeacidiphilus oryzae]|uniref:hypothetical protein n=1 Tax=Phaeacidiphilus oryzae TaxID=348818 RepID=UPI001F3A00C0|nr:hypothetical protein [Phaeacidiphilus oryzae]
MGSRPRRAAGLLGRPAGSGRTAGAHPGVGGPGGPWFAPALASAEPTDPRASLYGRITPVVRRPVAEAAPGRPVLGMADAVVLNDPVAGQGANTAARCAAVYLRAVLERGEDGPFDEDWMRDAFERFWSDHARHATAYTHALLGPPTEHALRAMAAAGRHPEVARRLGAGQEDPSTLADWWYSAEATDAYLAEVSGGGR